MKDSEFEIRVTSVLRMPKWLATILAVKTSAPWLRRRPWGDRSFLKCRT